MDPNATTHYEGSSMSGHSRNHLGHVYNTGTRHHYTYHTEPQRSLGGIESEHPTLAVSAYKCVSVPFTTVSAYTDRSELSRDLNEKLKEQHSGAGLAHGVAVIGMGGTGKTQLVLHHIQEHEEEYDTILWIDVRSEETARSSYERCCFALRLPFESSTKEGLLRDAHAVQAVMQYLQSRQRWLVIADNADNLKWDVSSVIPRGKMGAVIVTSQDDRASGLLGGRFRTIKIGTMEIEEAVSLISASFETTTREDPRCLSLVGEIAGALERLPLAMDLARARIEADIQSGQAIEAALRRYMTDYTNRRDDLLRDVEDFACMGSYGKTVLTVWDKSVLAEADRKFRVGSLSQSAARFHDASGSSQHPG